MANTAFEGNLHRELMDSLNRLHKIYNGEIIIKEVPYNPSNPSPGKSVKKASRKINEIQVKGDMMGIDNVFVSVHLGGDKVTKLAETFARLFKEGKYIMELFEQAKTQGIRSTDIAGVHGSKTTTSKSINQPVKGRRENEEEKKDSKANSKEPNASKQDTELETRQRHDEIVSLNDQIVQLQKQLKAKNETVEQLMRQKSIDSHGTKATLINEITRCIGRETPDHELFDQLMDKNSSMIDR